MIPTNELGIVFQPPPVWDLESFEKVGNVPASQLDAMRSIAHNISLLEASSPLTNDQRKALGTFNLWIHFGNAELVGRLVGTNEALVRESVDRFFNEPALETLMMEYDAIVEKETELQTKYAFNRIFGNAIMDLHEVLTRSELAYVKMANAGLSYPEIAASRFVEIRTVYVALSEARRKIEEARLNPKGIKRITDYKDEESPRHAESLSNAAQYGSLTTRLYLGLRYTTDDLVGIFLRNKRAADPEWVKDGWELLARLVPYKEILRFKAGKKYAPYLRHHPVTELVYVKREDIPIMRALYEPQYAHPKIGELKGEKKESGKIFP